ncbi:MAG: hypothetical protein CMM44_07315 [Rhodospirillaceae bacterium]|nr:hypothetical protein [Rhodospirillaceae bacterium]|tara:strand:- start:13749 stop:15065 length:1317 start_codon:yes stop_codon:yes gene_type:complete
MPVKQNKKYLSAIMQSAHQRTLELLQGLTDRQLIGPESPILNPILWEIGHVGWFHEHFILRKEHGHAPLLDRGDQLYDSIAVAHSRRWNLSLYSFKEITYYLEKVLEKCLSRLEVGLASERDSYLYQFTTFHEDMHDEAFTWARQTLSYPSPIFHHDTHERNFVRCIKTAPLDDGDAYIPGGRFELGARSDSAFLFDNEKWAHQVTVAPFRMAKSPVTNAEFEEFVEQGGYKNLALWSEDGLKWLQEVEAEHPVYWRHDKVNGWRCRRFDRWINLPPNEPIMHVCWYEAQAFCRWAGRRLPTEAEWEFAATMKPSPDGKELLKYPYPWGNKLPTPDHACLDGFSLSCIPVDCCIAGENVWGCRNLIGNVWEWTFDTFNPFPGFTPDDYKEYSKPLFGSTKVLRGGSWATRSRYVDGKYRNYFQPHRRDIFGGFRTCAL